MDTFYVVNRYINIIENGQIQTDKFISNQKTYRTDQQLAREINYSLETYQPEEIIYYTYNGDKTLFIEAVDNENNPVKYTSFVYKKGKLKQKKIYTNRNNSMTLSVVVKYKSKDNKTTIKRFEDKKLSQLITLTKEGTKNQQIDTIYYANGKQQRKVSYAYDYDVTGRVSMIEQTNTFINTMESETLLHTYIYDNNARLREIQIKNSSNNIKKKRNFMYFLDGRFSTVTEIDGNNKYLKNYTYTYHKSALDFRSRPVPAIK